VKALKFVIDPAIHDECLCVVVQLIKSTTVLPFLMDKVFIPTMKSGYVNFYENKGII
jgi:hypothetical protein